jgi:hypothetical protein
MFSILRLNNDSRLLWSVTPLFAWLIWGFLIGIPLHLWVGISRSSLVLFAAIQCALHVIASQWLFGARATAENPRGNVERRWIVVFIWLIASCEALFLQIFFWDHSDRAAMVIFLSTPVIVGFIFVLGRRWFIKVFGLAA